MQTTPIRSSRCFQSAVRHSPLRRACAPTPVRSTAFWKERGSPPGHGEVHSIPARNGVLVQSLGNPIEANPADAKFPHRWLVIDLPFRPGSKRFAGPGGAGRCWPGGPAARLPRKLQLARGIVEFMHAIPPYRIKLLFFRPRTAKTPENLRGPCPHAILLSSLDEPSSDPPCSRRDASRIYRCNSIMYVLDKDFNPTGTVDFGYTKGMVSSAKDS